jgi:hypothetical protein
MSTFDAPARCPKCGHDRLGPGKGPHAACLICVRCGRFIKWISKVALAELNELECELHQGDLTDALRRAADEQR